MKKVIEHKMCVLIFYTNLSQTFLILRRIQRDIITNVHTSTCNTRLVLSDFNENLNFLDRFSRNTQISNSMKSCPV
jgi:hypothetical protein